MQDLEGVGDMDKQVVTEAVEDLVMVGALVEVGDMEEMVDME